MLSWHVGHVYWFTILIVLRPTIALIVSEAVLDTNDDPTTRSALVHEATKVSFTYQRLVKTTPKPSATKKSKGELVGPPPPPPPPLLAGLLVAGGDASAEVCDGTAISLANKAAAEGCSLGSSRC